VEYTQYGGKMIRNVVNPTLTVYLPEESKATGAAVIVAPEAAFAGFHGKVKERWWANGFRHMVLQRLY
jgi:hypothetical protein